MAIFHIAIHDAVNGITRDYATYLPRIEPPAGASPQAAAIDVEALLLQQVLVLGQLRRAEIFLPGIILLVTFLILHLLITILLGIVAASFAFPALLSAIMVALVSAFVISINQGIRPNFLATWGKSCVTTWPVAFLAVTFIAPWVRGLVAKLTVAAH